MSRVRVIKISDKLYEVEHVIWGLGLLKIWDHYSFYKSEAEAVKGANNLVNCIYSKTVIYED